MTLKHTKASAHPTKAFFVRMLTRDISLMDCILDLIDNSVDAARRGFDTPPSSVQTSMQLAKFKIEMTITEEKFSIADNCGGLSVDDAAKYAFTFGNIKPSGAYTVGVYGIGMKRAVFKLGNEILIRSTTESETPFEVPINVQQWLEDAREEWDFSIKPSGPLPEPGVKVKVTKLNSDTQASFSDPTFLNRLRSTIAREYMLPLLHGLTVIINEQKVPGRAIAFKLSREYKPMKAFYQDGDVEIEIIAGMAESPPDSSDPSDRPVRVESPFGWYIFCNGRAVLSADRSELTGWGKEGPAWHPQYRGFIGVVLFSSKDSSLLPMTTTKRSVDRSSPTYRRTLTKMRKPVRAWIDYTNARKQKTEAAHKKEGATQSVSISNVRPRKSIKLPAEISGTATKEANVLYTVALVKMNALRKALGKITMTYREAGLKSFDYTYDRLVDEDES